MKKAIKGTFKDIYKKVPKREILGKAAVFGATQVIGAPYVNILSYLFKQSKNKVISYTGGLAYETFLRSKFARERLNAIPMAVVSMILRAILNFLIFSRLITGIWSLDFIVSVIITIGISLMSPIFYRSISVHSDVFMNFTNNIVDNFMGPNGWEYIDKIKNRFIFIIGITLIVLLQFVSVNSRYLQELVVHTLITGFITDNIQKYIIRLNVPTQVYYGMSMIEKATPHTYKYVSIMYTKIHWCNTNNIEIIIEKKPLKAKLISL